VTIRLGKRVVKDVARLAWVLVLGALPITAQSVPESIVPHSSADADGRITALNQSLEYSLRRRSSGFAFQKSPRRRVGVATEWCNGFAKLAAITEAEKAWMDQHHFMCSLDNDGVSPKLIVGGGEHLD
jgi:hypothetical protein